MTFRIPKNGVLNQPNKGDSSGNLFETQNIDLKTNPGKVRLSPRLTVAVKDNDTSISNMGVPIAFAYFDDQYHAACGVGGAGANGSGKIVRSDDTAFTSDWDNDGNTNAPSIISLAYSDMVAWRNGNYGGGELGESLLVSTFSTTSNIQRRYAGTATWETTYFTTVVNGSFRAAGGFKNMCVGFNKNLYITDEDRIIYIPIPTYQSHVNAVLTSSGAANTQAGTIDFNGQYYPIWIRTTSNRLWIGLMTFQPGTKGAKGYVAEWDTTGTAANKIYDIDAPCALSACVLDNVLYIIDAYGRLKKFDGTGFKEVARLPVANQNIEMPGIYDVTTNARWIHHRGMDVVDGRINIVVNNFVSSGVYVEDMPSGVWEHVEPTVNSSGFLYHKNSPCADSNDNGQKLISTAGAIFGTKRTAGTYLAGFGYYTDNGSTERKGVFYDDVATNTNKRGIFTTPFVMAEQIDDNWQKGSYRHSPLPSGDKIIAKYRTQKSTTLPFIASCTFTSTTTFTSTDANFANITGGEECEFVMGKHSGTTTHVSSISESGGTYTITVDEAILSASGSGKVKMTNFKKIATFSDQTSMEHDAPIMDTSTKVQMKTEMRFTGNTEIDDLTIINKGHKLTQ